MMDPALTHRYLRALLARYATITVPGGTLDRPLSLRAVFQPLKLRSMALAPEEQASRGQRQPSQAEKQVMRCREALEESPSHKIVILGSPGMGKTTALKSLLVDAAQEALDDPDAPLPIFLTLPDLARSGLSLPDYLAGVVAAFDLPTDFAAALWQEICRGKALLCLDSLDEVAPARRPDMIALINAGAREWGGMWIVGSRFTDYKGWQFERGEFSEWEMLPMTADLRTRLAERLIPLLYEGMYEEEMPVGMPAVFVQTLQGRPQFAAWGENPLLFTLAAVAFVHMGIFPESRAMLYEDVLEAVLMMRAAQEEQRAELRRVLASVALQFYQVKGRTFTRADLLQLLMQVRADFTAEWDVESIGERVIGSGLLDVLNYETYGFLHQTFQEYLAALALAEQLLCADSEAAAWELAWSKRTYSRWSEVLRLMVGILAEREEPGAAEMAQRWLRSLAGQRTTAEGDPGDLGLILAVRSLREVAGPASRELATSIVLQWIEALDEAAHRGRRTLWDNPRSKRLLELASEIRFFDERVVNVTIEQLTRSLQDDAWQVRQNGVEALGKLPGEATSTLLVETLTSEQDDQVRWSILRALNEREQRAPLPLLLSILRTCEWHMTMAEAVRAITLYGDEAPLEPLLDALRTTDDGSTIGHFARSILEGLGRRGAAALDELLPELTPEKSNFVVDAFGNPRFAAIAPVQTLLNFWRCDPGATMPLLAGNALRLLAVPLPIETLVTLLLDGAEEDFSGHILDCLRNTYASNPEEVIAALSHPAPRVRASVLEALRIINGAISTAQAAAMARDESPLVRKAALDVLHWIAIKRARLEGADIDKEQLLEPFLIACADNDESVREKAVRSLTWLPRHIGVRPSVAPFHALAGDRNPEIRALAMRALAECGDLDALLAGLEDEASVVRLAVVESLGRFPIAAPLAPLFKALRDESAGVRRAAAEALRKHNTPEALSALIDALEDSSLRGMAIESLGYFGEQAPLERIVAYLHDSDEWTRWHAIEALHRLRPPAYLGILVVMLESMTDYDDMKKAHWMLQDLAEVLAAHPAALGEASSNVRWVALGVLEWMGERAPGELIFAALHDWSVNVRCRAAHVVRAHCSEAGALEKLLPLLKDGNADVRRVTLDLLQGMGKHVPVEAIRPLLRDEKSYVRARAIQVLGAMDNPANLNTLINMLNDEDEEVRSAAARILSRPEMDTPDEVLLGALKHVEAYARVEILKALGRRPDVPDTILEDAVRNDPDEYARKVAKEALRARREPAVTTVIAGIVDEDAEGPRNQPSVERGNAASSEIPPLDALLEEISRGRVRQLSLLQQAYPDKVAAIEVEAISILTGKGSGAVLGAYEQYDIIRLIRKIKRPLPGLMGKLAEILEWPYTWIQREAIKAFGELRRNVPDRALRRLYHLRLDSPSAEVREAADDVLAEILAQEPGIEDDESESGPAMSS
jgi:HEAT repeat protein